MLKRLISWLMVVGLCMSLSTKLPPASADDSAEAARVRRAAQAALKARWSVMISGSDQLAEFYDSTAEARANLAQVESLMQRHYSEPASEAGFEYTSVKVTPEIAMVAVSGDRAVVEALVSVDYTSLYHGSGKEHLTKEADVPFRLSFIKRGNTWYLVTLESEDTVSKVL